MLADLTYRAPRTPLVEPGEAELHARDMTATFSADMTLAEAQRRLAEIGQWLPVDGWPGATLGRLVEVNSTGPLRLGFGAWRDLLLGVQFVNGNRELVTAGGRTVKNVAGYDLTKFMVGQHGMFGRVVTVTTRTYRRPDGALLVRHRGDGGVVQKLLDTALRPQWAMWGAREGIRLGYLGDETTLAWYEAKVGESGPVHVQRRTVEEDMADRAERWAVGKEADDGTEPWRAAVPPARLGELWEGLGSVMGWADAAFGIATGRLRGDAERETVEAAVKGAGGTVRVGDGAAAAFSTSEAERQIIERLKAAFDPDGTLNPLPWQRS
jgi:FAD/FMN-containing dehydrogenase